MACSVNEAKMTKIILTRHGHIEGIDPERYRGRADVPLTELGEAQAKAVASRIGRAWTPKVIYTSPLSRCVATGAEIARVCRADSRILEGLVDLDYGQWQWRPREEVRSIWPALYAAWYATPHLVRLPDGDSLQDVAARAADALRLVLLQHSEAETVVLVGHDSVNRALLLQLLDQPLSAYWRVVQSPCAINEIDITGGSIRVQRINDTSHLESIA
jgi:phosphoserine phosphatase